MRGAISDERPDRDNYSTDWESTAPLQPSTTPHLAYARTVVYLFAAPLLWYVGSRHELKNRLPRDGFMVVADVLHAGPGTPNGDA